MPGAPVTTEIETLDPDVQREIKEAAQMVQELGTD